MLILRVLGLLLAVAVALSVGAWLITGDKRYSVLSVRLLKFGLAVALVFMAILLFERVLAPVI